MMKKHWDSWHLALYVDDMAVVGGPEVVESFLICIQLEWKCSAPEFVKEGAWVKFCGFELSKRGDQFLLGRSPTLKIFFLGILE